MFVQAKLVGHTLGEGGLELSYPTLSSSHILEPFDLQQGSIVLILLEMLL